MKVKMFVIFLIFLFVATTSLYGCGDRKTIDGVTYGTYGLLNEGSKRNENIEYEVIWGNVVWSVILIETIVAPIYFLGFSLFEPVGKIDHSLPKGAVRD